MARTASPSLLKSALAAALCGAFAVAGCADDAADSGAAADAADGGAGVDSITEDGSSEPAVDSGADVDSHADESDAQEPDDVDVDDGSDGSGADTTDGHDGSGAMDAATEPSLLEALHPTLCLAADVAGELVVNSAGLRALPAEVRRWAPLTALLMQVGLPATDDEQGQALVADRAQAVVTARACESVECVGAALAMDEEFAERLRNWLLQHEVALGQAQSALGLAADSDLQDESGDIEPDWARRLVDHHRAALDAGLRVGAGHLDPTALASALDSAAPGDSGTLDLAAAAIARELARAAGRDEAIRYEPHIEGENSAAYARLQSLDFQDWPYSVILVPGQGPTDDVTPLSPLSIERADLAVERLRVGLAPFILLSGGHVHPEGTPWSEAMEMKSYLMRVHGISEEQIIVDPWARHTTTNLRNAARVLAHMGIPLEHPILVTSDPFQSAYIAFLITDRSLNELGYVPWRALESLGVNDACAILTRSSLRVDPTDALDP